MKKQCILLALLLSGMSFFHHAVKNSPATGKISGVMDKTIWTQPILILLFREWFWVQPVCPFNPDENLIFSPLSISSALQ
jgi:hypothetical protein